MRLLRGISGRYSDSVLEGYKGINYYNAYPYKNNESLLGTMEYYLNHLYRGYSPSSMYRKIQWQHLTRNPKTNQRKPSTHELQKWKIRFPVRCSGGCR